MTNANTAIRQGLAKKPYSAGLGTLVILSTLLSMLAAWFLAFDLLGYHVRGRGSHPAFSALILLLGLSVAALAQQLGGGRNEGISVRGWVGVLDVLHIRLALAAVVFMGCVLRFAIAGKQIPFYPVGALTVLSGFLIGSRFLTKYVFHLDRRKRVKS